MLADFRLTAASVIISNLPHIACHTSDMRHMNHIAELCEQYSLLIVLNYLATRYGLPLCSEAIKKDPALMQVPLLSWPSLADRYPLHLHEVFPELFKISDQLYPLLEQSFPAELELAGELHQQSLEAPLVIDESNKPYIDRSSDNRSNGEFYTPAWVADYAFEEWFKANSDVFFRRLKKSSELDYKSFPKIFDPACGTGNFLLASMRQAAKADLAASEFKSFLENSIYGKDIDGRALEIAKLLLIVYLGQYFKNEPEKIFLDLVESSLNALDRHMKLSDSLLESLCLDSELSEPDFDLVISNPPYISFGSRDQQCISKEWQQLLKRRFPASSEYKIRFTSIFQEIGIELLKSQNSQCIFLVPDAFLTGSYYARLRQLIISNAELKAFSELPENTIAGATVGRWCLAHYGRKKTGGTAEFISLASINRLGNELEVRRFEMPGLAFISKDRQRFQLVFSKEDLEILELCKNYAFLKEQLKGHTGIRARQGQKSILANKQNGPAFRPGLISGAELSPFKIDWQGNFIEIIPEKLFAGGFDPDLVSNPKVLVRQTGDSLVAAADFSGLYHLNNVHSFVPLIAPGRRHEQVYYYTSILNSSFFRYFYGLKTREQKRALAQIDIETVEHLPLPSAEMSLKAEINELGRSLSYDAAAKKIEIEKQSAKNRKSIESDPMRQELNRLVFKLFALPEYLQEHIMNSFC